MTIMARYSGVCIECGERWQPGDLIRAGDCTEDGRPTAWMHAACPLMLDPAVLRPGETVCTDCWLVHPEGACDR